MTIKHKKKNPDRPLENEASETAALHAGTHLGHHNQHQVNMNQQASTLGQMPVARQERLFVAGSNSPPVWPVARDETAAQYEEPQPISGKRRHRASPHRSVRAKHRDRSERATASPTFHAVSPPSSVAPLVAAGAAGPSVGALEGDATGYNSGDEYGTDWNLTEDQWQEKERQFERKLKKKGLLIKRTVEDGACLFRAVADQIFGDEEMHQNVRKYCMEYILSNEDYYSQYITEDFRDYVRRKSKPWVHGNHIEIQAMSEMYSRTIEVLCYSSEAINIFHAPQSTSPQAGSGAYEPIRLSYHRGTHYNSVVNPYKATVGVGLGLPGYAPGLADSNLLTDAAKKSEEFHIEQAMLEDKLKATDWEATNETISEQVARESYLQWLKDNEKRNKTSNASSSTATSAEARSPRPLPARSPSAPGLSSPARSPSGRGSPRGAAKPSPLTSPRQTTSAAADAAETSAAAAAQDRVGSPLAAPGPSRDLGFPLLETASFMNQLPPAMFGLSEWEDAGILAQVLAASQQEYLDSLKKSKGDGSAAASCSRSADGAGPSTSS